MKKINVADATNMQLDWLVAKIEGVQLEYGLTDDERFCTDWSQGGPIIERERVLVEPFGAGVWRAAKADEDNFTRRHYSYRGPTPLIAAMRCFVASRLGDTVEVPEELT